MARTNHLLVCFAHGRFLHPLTLTWLPLPDQLQDWAEEQTGAHWLFTAALCNQCLAAGQDEEETL